MRGSLRIATIAGIPVGVHWSFFLLFLWVIYKGLEEGQGWMPVLWLAIFVAGLFLCVVFHEFGHALTARRFGVATRDIILYPIGGVARLEHIPEKPSQEFLIAIAGPAVNVLLVLLLSPYFIFVQPLGSFLQTEVPSLSSSLQLILPSLALSNLLLAVFNLLPAFPMDGGRILRSLLSIPLGRYRATRVASIIGQVLAVGLVLLGLWQSGFIMILIGIFVFFAARQEFKVVHFDKVLSDQKAGEIMRTEFTPLRTFDTLERARAELQAGQEKHFLVFDEQYNLQGVLLEPHIVKAAQEGHLGLSVERYMSLNFEKIAPGESLKNIYHKIYENGYGIFPVVEAGRVLGVLDVYMINQFLRLRR